MTDIEAAEAEFARLNAKFRSYEGGDRAPSPPVSLMRELNAAEVRLRQLLTAGSGAGVERAESEAARLAAAVASYNHPPPGTGEPAPRPPAELLAEEKEARRKLRALRAAEYDAKRKAPDERAVQAKPDMSIDAIMARHNAKAELCVRLKTMPIDPETHADRGELLRIIAKMRKDHAQQPDIHPMKIAAMFAGAGDAELPYPSIRLHDSSGCRPDPIPRTNCLTASPVAPEKPALAVGMRVKAKRDPEKDCEYKEEAVADRARHDGQTGTCIRLATEHGPCWRVDHGNGEALWEPDELTPVPCESHAWIPGVVMCMSCGERIQPLFQPTAEEVAACPVLAEVAGKPEREAVTCLGQLLTDALAREKREWEVARNREIESNGLRTQQQQHVAIRAIELEEQRGLRIQNEELSRHNGRLREEVDRCKRSRKMVEAAQEAAGEVLRLDWGVRDETSQGAKALIGLAIAHGFVAPLFDVKKPAASQGQRSRVGPWISHLTSACRYDALGHRVAEVSINIKESTWGGWANRSFGSSVVIETHGSEEQARAAVDAVLAPWADLDGEPAHAQKDKPPSSDPHDHWVAWRGSVSDFVTDLRAVMPAEKLAKLYIELAPVLSVRVSEPPTPSVRLWTEQQIKEAWCRAQETSRLEYMPTRSTSALENEWQHVRAALHGEAP